MKRSLAGTFVFASLLLACSERRFVDGGVLFAGRVAFEDELAAIETGSVFINVFNRRGDRIPSYCRKYDLGDPAFRSEGGGLVLRFELDSTHNMAGMGMPLGDDPEVEVRFDPDGQVETKDGVRSAWTKARRGTTGIAVVLDAGAEAPEPTSRPTSQPTSRPTPQPTE